MMKVECPDCGQKIRPCNHARHRRAKHLPKQQAPFTRWAQPPEPMPSRKGEERRYDEHVPRGEGAHRYRLYRLRAGDLALVASAPDPASLGLALVTCHNEGEFSRADDSVGCLDTLTDPGVWLINPWSLGRRAEE